MRKNLEYMSAKTNFPDSDESARKVHPLADEEQFPDDAEESILPGLQISGKSGKHSAAEKLAASRPEFGTGRRAEPVPGAFGKDETQHPAGRNASPGTNRYHCETCGRYFNTEEELSAHETECRLAKAAAQGGHS